jgi:ABC-2 type transport system permease protein
MLHRIVYDLRVIWACAKKDIKSALSERTFTIVGVFLPVNALILMSLFVVGGSQAPTAVVMQDTGPYAQQLYAAMSQAHSSFRLQKASASEARDLIESGRIVAVVTIPPDFDTRVSQNQPVQVKVEINNLNTDFTNDIRRAVPLSITLFYEKAFPRVLTIVPRENDLYPLDTDYIPYLTVSVLVVAIMIGALISAGTAAAREWELETMKELLLSPAPRWAVLVGKMLGTFIISLASVALVLAVLILVVGVWPAHWDEVIGYTLLTLIIFIVTGTLFGNLLKRRQPVTVLSVATSLPLFFLSGAFGPISFNTPVLQFLARIFPVYYAIVLQQHAFHDFTLNTLGTDVNVLILCGFVLGVLALTTILLRRTTVAH